MRLRRKPERRERERGELGAFEWKSYLADCCELLGRQMFLSRERSERKKKEDV